MGKQFIFAVAHPEHETVHVTAQDRLHAVVEAAHAWGITKWTEVARECQVLIVEEAPVKKTKARSMK